MDNYYTNSSFHMELDVIKYNENKTIFPKKYLEYLIDTINLDYFEYDKEHYYYNEIVLRELIQQCVSASYAMENWIEEVETIKTYMSEELSEDDKQTIKNGNIPNMLNIFCDTHMKNNKEYFFRLNICSPKDVGNCFVKCANDIVKIINLSDRLSYFMNTNIPIRIVLRKPIYNFPTEYRLFMCDLKLRAISQNDNTKVIENKEKIYNGIIEFFNNNVKYIPYVDATIDIININNKWIILEFNPFGAETMTGSALYNWNLDYHILYYSENPVIKFNNPI